jgi:hypothetical protein
LLQGRRQDRILFGLEGFQDMIGCVETPVVLEGFPRDARIPLFEICNETL